MIEQLDTIKVSDKQKMDVAKYLYLLENKQSNEYFERKLRQQIENENISGVFDKYGLGDARSKADKQIKATIIEKIFGTTSQTEISKMNHELLKKKRLELDEMFTQLSTAQPENVIDWVMSYQIKAAA